MTRVGSLMLMKLDVDTTQERSQTYASLAHGFASPQEGLEVEYARLFVGPGRPVAHPYESVYREGQMMGDCTLAVRQHYATEGLAPESHFLPDHVAVELEFMAHLAQREAEAREQSDEDLAVACLRQQEDFLREHLVRWIPSFCQQVLTGDAHPFYASLAQRAWEYVAQDVAQVRAWLSATESTGERTGWAVAIGSSCTLCGLCARLCPRKALLLKPGEGEACLLFDPAVCDGCAACQQWCPERVITVEPCVDVEGQRVLLVRSTMAECPVCGEPSMPTVLLARVQQRVAEGDEALRAQLALCSACRASSPINSLTGED